MSLAKECGEVGGQGIDELLPFLFMFIQVGEIGRELRQSQGPYTTGQAAVEHLFLAIGQLYAGLLIEQATCLLEIGPGVVELAQRRLLAHRNQALLQAGVCRLEMAIA